MTKPTLGADIPSRAVLLDTCALLDLSVDPLKIKADVRDSLSDLSTTVVVSAASAWEIAIKVRQGKLPGGEHLTAAWGQSLIDLKADPLDIDADDAIRAGTLRWAHRDPFDRMLVAQAIRHNLPVVTSDNVIIDAGMVPTINSRG
ncbi:MAG: type II toxin-antitoxin system VapC family toxin [Actinomycetia bacterium]|nr:type II toxin-antitoxin system VapC family toxin [Actinomycetes bacterium]